MHDITPFRLTLDEEGNPTDMWSNDEKVLRAKGGWVTRLATQTCADIQNDFEDFLVEEAPKTCHVEGNKKKCQ